MPAQRTYSINKIRKTYPNAYKKWSVEDDALLRLMLEQNRDVDFIAVFFGRQPSAIYSRAEKLGNPFPYVPECGTKQILDWSFSVAI